jgi:molecular chaperone IbpA
MTHFDFSPLFRSSVGFDRLMRLVENSVQQAESVNGYPPYNIEKSGEDQYRITLAVAGFGEDELALEVNQNVLMIEGRQKEGEGDAAYLYRGIAGRSFKRQFQLADHVKVADARLHNGLLVVDLVRELPEAMKPRRIAISTAEPATIAGKGAKRIESAKKAA